MSELPDSWSIAHLDDVAAVKMGQSPDSRFYNDERKGLPFFQGKAEFGDLYPSVRKWCSVPSKTASAGDILLSVRAPVGPTNLAAEDCCIGRGLAAIRANGDFSQTYLLHYFRHIQQWLSEQGTGSTFTAVSGDFLRNLNLPLAPANEQRRIVAKIEALQARSRKAREALEAIPPLLEQFRQSVLAAAFRGDLTADWREQHPDVEPASVLLERIRAERRRKWEQAELAKFKAKGKVPKDDSWKEQYVEPESVDDVDLPELPKGWCWERIGLLGVDPFCAVQTGPFGAQLHNTEFVDSGVPVIAVGNLTGLGFTTEGLYFVTSQKAAALARYDVHAGDILFARSGATLGKVCVAPEFVSDWRMTGHILRGRLRKDVISPELVVFALWGDATVKSLVTGGIRGMTRPGFNTGLLEGIPIPIPPREEQDEILRQVMAALGRIEALEKVLDEIALEADMLNQSILAKAFRGELVPQDPNDEPASVLLERIQAEQAEDANDKPPRGRRKRTSKVMGDD